MNKLWKSQEQLMNKSQTKCEQVVHDPKNEDNIKNWHDLKNEDLTNEEFLKY